ncbi:rho GTPase-activating protein 24-like [Gigantopelta aegis]|uniref:rho GTPase-activating protein 24-like n=1 Tax=Gigantopelta aegis TaxID=1735272 RepID=UPI001B887DC1|nr:rho GTPase-activating protein 24-like [Gigantopelta aegis]
MDSPNQDGCIKRGWLMKKGGLMKTTWQHRYFALSGNFLIYYIKEDDIKSQGSILLDQHRILEQPISPDEPDHFIFEIVSAKGHRNADKKIDSHEMICLCAPSDAERQGWIKALRHAMYAHRGGAIFGQKLEETMKYTRKQKRKIPFIIEECVEFLYKNGLESEGIFRLPGRAVVIRDLKEKFDCGELVSLSKLEADVHSVSSLLKLYLRELPESIIPCKHYQKFMNFALRFLDVKEDPLKMEVVVSLKSFMPQLPVDNYNILKYLCRMLNSVGQKSSVNKMSMLNIATVFGPNIIRHMDDNPELFMMTAEIAQQLAFMLINYFDIVFELEYDSGPTSPEPVPVEDLLKLSHSDQNPVLGVNVLPSAESELAGLHIETDDVFLLAAPNDSKTFLPGGQFSPMNSLNGHVSDAAAKQVVLRQDSDSSTASQSEPLKRNSPRFTEDGRPIPPKRKSKIIRGRPVSANCRLGSWKGSDSSVTTTPNVSVATTPESPGPSFENDVSSLQKDRLLLTKETQTDDSGGFEEKNSVQYFTQDDMQAKEKEISTLKEDKQAKEQEIKALKNDMQAKERDISTLKEVVAGHKNKYDSTVKALRAEIDNMKEKYEKRIETLEAVFKTQNLKYEAESNGRAEAVETVVKLRNQLHQYQMQYGELP